MSHSWASGALVAAGQEAADDRGELSSRLTSVFDGYELWAQTYDRDPNPLLALEERQLEPLLPDLQCRFVLDVACGTGRWLRKLLSRGARAGAGMDFSSAMLEEASAKTLLGGRLVRGDLLAIPFPSGVSDLIICSFAVGHIINLQALAGELARVARAKADVFVTDLHPQGYARGWRCTFRQAERTVEVSSIGRSIEQIEQAFESGGFELVGRHEPCLGGPEKPIFARAGKLRLFEAACEGPAVLICHFKRDNSPSSWGGESSQF